MISEERLAEIETEAHKDGIMLSGDVLALIAEARRLQAHAAEVRSHYLEEQRALIEKTGEVERLQARVAELKELCREAMERCYKCARTVTPHYPGVRMKLSNLAFKLQKVLEIAHHGAPPVSHETA